LSTQSCDRPFVEERLKELYKNAGYEAPKVIYWVLSPRAGVEKLRELTGRKEFEPCIYGQLDLGAIASWTFLRDQCGVELPQLAGLEGMAHCCWAWVWDEFAILCERPTRIDLDEENRLHNETTTAIEWPDGWGFCEIHGVRIPVRRWIEKPETITLEEIKKQNNTEVKRVLIDRFGIERYLDELGVKEVAKDDYGVLYEHEGVAIVKVVCPTSGRTYFRQVRPGLESAHQAVASTFGLTADEYQPEIQT
jgi:hypothetical protein